MLEFSDFALDVLSGALFLEHGVSTIPLTVRGAQRLKDELQRLKSVERPAVIAAISEARAQGDLSENAEYDAAKEKQGFIEGRIAEVEAKLASAQVIDPTTLDAEGRVVFGATVDLEDLSAGENVTYQIVGDDEADIKDGKISVSSPIARALIGRSAGDVAVVTAPGGLREYEVLDVRYL
jgi:transcription elongation factor GreA